MSKCKKGGEGGLEWVEVSSDTPSNVVVSLMLEGEEGTEDKDGIEMDADLENGVADHVTW